MAADPVNLTTTLIVHPKGVTGESIAFEFETMPGNTPGEYGDTIYIWQTSSQAIPSSAPLKSHSVPVNTPDGSDVFEGLSVNDNSYLIGYAVGGDVANVCATAWIPKLGAGNPVSVTPSVGLGEIGTTSLEFDYQAPDGTKPESDGDWAGLWQGQGEAALYAMPPTWKVEIGQDNPRGNGSFDNINLERGVEYTVGYFKGGWNAGSPQQSTLACSVTFTN